MKYQINLALSMLDNSYLLQQLEGMSVYDDLDEHEYKKSTYLLFSKWNREIPDHIFNMRWNGFLQQHEHHTNNVTYGCLHYLSDLFLDFYDNTIHVKLEHYNQWQSVLSRISSIPIQAMLLTKQQSDTISKVKINPVVYPFDPVIEEYIQKEGLHETHLHLNGTTPAEECWLRALNQPKIEIFDFSKNYHKNIKLRELCHTIDSRLTPERLNYLLIVANQIRSILIQCSQKILYEKIYNFEDILLNRISDLYSFEKIGDEKIENTQQEAGWIRILLKVLEQGHYKILDRLLHVYLLIQAQYIQLNVQREDMYGFDQFQKYTFTDLREPAEKEYTKRFKQLHGSSQYYSRVGWLEGRFAPKPSFEKMNNILFRILQGYSSYLSERLNEEQRKSRCLSKTLCDLEDQINHLKKYNSRSYLKLTLVIHFIKKAYSPKKESYRHSLLHSDLFKQVAIIHKIIQNYPKLSSSWIRGIDAAANELDAPVNVFAPYYRYCRKIGIRHKTYHVGEDFLHFLSGIRSVIDVIDLLDFQVGDRIGHGTVLGIDPQLWLETMPDKLFVKKGDWLIDLLIIWKYLLKSQEHVSIAYQISSEIHKLAYQIFHRDFNCELLYQFVQIRGLTPYFVLKVVEDEKWCWQTASLNDLWRDEAKLVSDEFGKQEAAVRILADWLSNKLVIARCEELLEVNSDYLNHDVMLFLQQTVLDKLKKQRVIIETLPTSNVRISQYKHYREHHVFRWMKVPFMSKHNDPNVLVSLGSDDPGIFANDISCDFYQLYAVLQEQGFNDIESLNYLSELNERGRQYRFHDKNLF